MLMSDGPSSQPDARNRGPFNMAGAASVFKNLLIMLSTTALMQSSGQYTVTILAPPGVAIGRETADQRYLECGPSYRPFEDCRQTVTQLPFQTRFTLYLEEGYEFIDW